VSHENVEIVRRLNEIMDREGVGRVFDTAVAEGLFDEDLEWVEDPSGPDSGTYKGLSTVRSLVAERMEAFDLEQKTERLIDAGDDVVALVRWRARGQSSGAEAELRLAMVSSLRGGRIVRVRFYLDPTEALKAAGIEE
jgi:ketosteroid isomerase-like protein